MRLDFRQSRPAGRNRPDDIPSLQRAEQSLSATHIGVDDYDVDRGRFGKSSGKRLEERELTLR
jgi:hypothetical protein